MNLRLRLILLMVLLTALPAVPVALRARALVARGFDLGLSTEVDAALQAGLRQVRAELATRRVAVREDLERMARDWSQDAATLAPTRPEDRVTTIDARGQERVLRAGAPGLETNQEPLDPDAPPRVLRAEHSFPTGDRLVLVRPVESRWRDDAAALANGLQLLRGLQLQRGQLERTFWVPFLMIYGLTLAIGVAMAVWLTRGITVPVQRLLHATDAVAAGRWDVQVASPGRDEVGRLSERFNSMVRTLDAQNRRLVDLETMAGWREMARALAHEVKNPLTPIQLTVEEMRERYAGDDPAYRELLDECTRIVVEEVDSLRNVVSRFREFSRPVELRVDTMLLNRLLEDVAALQRDLRVVLELDPAVAEVELDEDRFRQVFMNLAENARSATRGVDEPRLCLRSQRRGEEVWIEVEDNGPGIAADQRERVFEPYRSGTAGGLGLGLALVKGIVLAHHGRIEVADGRLGGACFRLVLPRRQPQPAPTSESLVASPPAPSVPPRQVPSRGEARP